VLLIDLVTGLEPLKQYTMLAERDSDGGHRLRGIVDGVGKVGVCHARVLRDAAPLSDKECLAHTGGAVDIEDPATAVVIGAIAEVGFE
jgi:hypothetical protein